MIRNVIVQALNGGAAVVVSCVCNLSLLVGLASGKAHLLVPWLFVYMICELYGGIWWYMVVYGDIWWYMVVYGGICWYMLVYGGIWWYMVVYGGIWGYTVVYGGI